MAFNFTGIFAVADLDVLAAAQDAFDSTARAIYAPFEGFGISRVGKAIPVPDCDDEEESLALAESIRQFSERFPAVTFVYLYVECFGGVCDYAGFAIRNGERIHDEPFGGVDGNAGPLRRLVTHLGVRLGDSHYFAPLRRGFFADRHPTPSGDRAMAEPVWRPPPPLESGWSKLWHWLGSLIGH